MSWQHLDRIMGELLLHDGPVAADEGVGLVPRHDAFVGLDGDDFAEVARIDDLLDLAIEGGEAQHEADHHPPIRLPGQALDFQDLLDAGRDRFFQQDVIAKLQRPRAVLEMGVVLGGDDHHVREFAGGQDRIGVWRNRENRDCPRWRGFSRRVPRRGRLPRPPGKRSGRRAARVRVGLGAGAAPDAGEFQWL